MKSITTKYNTQILITNKLLKIGDLIIIKNQTGEIINVCKHYSDGYWCELLNIFTKGFYSYSIRFENNNTYNYFILLVSDEIYDNIK